MVNNVNPKGICGSHIAEMMCVNETFGSICIGRKSVLPTVDYKSLGQFRKEPITAIGNLQLAISPCN